MTQKPNCYNCNNCLTCFMRIELARTIQSFKLLAENPTEVARTTAQTDLSYVWQSIAKTCTAYKPE